MYFPLCWCDMVGLFYDILLIKSHAFLETVKHIITSHQCFSRSPESLKWPFAIGLHLLLCDVCRFQQFFIFNLFLKTTGSVVTIILVWSISMIRRFLIVKFMTFTTPGASCAEPNMREKKSKFSKIFSTPTHVGKN